MRHFRRSAVWIVLTLLLMTGIGAPVYVLTREPALEGAVQTYRDDPAPAETARFLTYDAATGLYGYADGSGAVVIEPRFARAGRFLEGLAPVQIEADSGGAAYGYIDASGTMVIQPQFKTAAAFCEGLARVELTTEAGDRFGFIDRAGVMVIEPQYVAAWDFSEGLARVAAVDGSGLLGYGFIDRTGLMVIEPRFESARDFSQGLAAVAVDDVWGYIDATGAWAIEPQFTYALSFLASNLAAVDLEAPGTTVDEASTTGEGYSGLPQAYINKTGEIVWRKAED